MMMRVQMFIMPLVISTLLFHIFSLYFTISLSVPFHSFLFFYYSQTTRLPFHLQPRFTFQSHVLCLPHLSPLATLSISLSVLAPQARLSAATRGVRWPQGRPVERGSSTGREKAACGLAGSANDGKRDSRGVLLLAFLACKGCLGRATSSAASRRQLCDV
jgi:hypothetical protein